MNLPQVDLGKVTTLGTLLVAPLLVLAGLAGITVATHGPTWFLIGVFIMLTLDFVVILGSVGLSVKYRQPHFLLATAERFFMLSQQQFKGFHGDTTQLRSEEPGRLEPGSLDDQRDGIYVRNHYLFLVHRWFPSSKEGQVADLVISLWGIATPQTEGPYWMKAGSRASRTSLGASSLSIPSQRPTPQRTSDWKFRHMDPCSA